jgi:branched-subunit amino acid transport protein
VNIWLVMFAGGLLTFATRFSLIFLFGRIQVSDTLRRALHYVPPAVLTAIVVPEILFQGDALQIAPGNHRLVAALAAILVAGLTKNTLTTIVAGMLALFAGQLISG